MPEPAKRLVLLYHGAKEGRGAWFDPINRPAVTQAAETPHHALIEITQVQLDQVDPNLSAGVLGPDGKPAPLPVMLRASFERLLAMAEPGKPGAKPVPRPWSELVVGSVVLASDKREEGWWECVVTGIGPDRTTVRLKWRDYPDLGEFTKPVSRVGLMPHSGRR